MSSRHPLPPPRSAGGSGSSAGTGESDTGAAFVQRFRSLADAQPLAADVASGSGCCGSKAAQGQGATSQSGGSSCGCSGGAATSGPQAAAAAPSQLNSLMGGLEGTLSREDLQAAFQSGPSASGGAAGSPGERFLDVAAILRGKGCDDDPDADLDALVV